MARLFIESGEGRGREYRVSGSVVLGRLKSNPVPVEDAKASREHAAIRAIGADYFLVDLDSRNGTQLNGRAVRQQEPIRSGDRIQIGATVILFQEDAEDQARRADLAALAKGPPPTAPKPPVAPPAAPVGRPVPTVSRGWAQGAAARFRKAPEAPQAVSVVIMLVCFVLALYVSRFIVGFLISAFVGS